MHANHELPAVCVLKPSLYGCHFYRITPVREAVEGLTILEVALLIFLTVEIQYSMMDLKEIVIATQFSLKSR